MLKTHWPNGCGRGKRTSLNTRQVDCQICKGSGEFAIAEAEQEAARLAAIDASPARPVANPWDGSLISCNNCGNGLFKDAGRSLFSYNHKCANCGTMNHTMTETGMCT